MTHSGFTRLIDIGGEKLLFQVIEIFLNQIPPKIDACQQHLQRQEYKAVHLLAHAIKSSAANLGLNELIAQAAQLELSSEKAEIENCQQIFTEIQAIFPGVLEMLQKKYNELEDA